MLLHNHLAPFIDSNEVTFGLYDQVNEDVSWNYSIVINWQNAGSYDINLMRR